MTPNSLYRDPVLLDAAQHRGLTMVELTDYSVAAGLHAAFLASSEFAPAALAMPIVFIRGEADANGVAPVSPIALLGLTGGENLQVEGTRWVGRYIPAVVRRYPFITAPVDGRDAPGIHIDRAWPGFSDDAGVALFDAEGRPTEALAGALRFIDLFDAETRQTRAFCESLAALDVLQPMKADATLPNGEQLSVDGFFTVDEEKLRRLPDAQVLGLHRSGMLALLQAHLISLLNMRHLVDRKAARVAAAAAAPSA